MGSLSLKFKDRLRGLYMYKTIFQLFSRGFGSYCVYRFQKQYTIWLLGSYLFIFSGCKKYCYISSVKAQRFDSTKQNVRVLACERRSAKMNACEVNGAEIKERKHGGEIKVLAEIREIKLDLASLKKQAKDYMSVNREVSTRYHNEDPAQVASIASRAKNLVTLRQSAQRIQNIRGTRP